MSAIQQFGGRSLQFTKVHTPEILAVVGVAGVITSGVLAARATLKLEGLVETLERTRTLIHEAHQNGTLTDQELAKKLFAAQRDFVLGLIKIYGIPAALGVASIGALLGGQGILKKRNVALVGAYSSLEQAYKEYRRRVVEAVGEEKESEIRLNLRAMGEQTEGDESDKPMALLTEEEIKKQALGASPYATFFDRYSSPLFSPEHDYNLTILRAQQTYANQKLIANGYLFLNDVLDSLELPRTEAGQFVGWVYDPNEPGDKYVDFGMDNFENIRRGAYLDGTEGSVLLDFNVDGNIINKVWKKK